MPASDVEQRVVPLVQSQPPTLTAIDFEKPLSGARMKGFPLLHLLDAMERARGPDLAIAWRATLPEHLRANTDRRAVTSVAWLPIEYYFHGVGFAARELYGEGARHAMRVGHQTAEADIGAFFRFVLSMASPATVLSLSGRFWKGYFDQSTLTVISSSSGQCVAEVRDWPLRDEVSLHEMAGSLVAWMEASRAKDVRMTRFELLAPGHFVLGCSWT
jgi:hypothetical protein